MKIIKERIYNSLVRKNGRVWYEYERYVREHMEEHHLHRLRHLRVLFKLNWFYRVKKGNTPYLYWDVPLDPNKQNENVLEPLTEITEEPNITNINALSEKSNRPICSNINFISVRSNEIQIEFDMFQFCNIYKKIDNAEYKFVTQLNYSNNYVDYDIYAGKQYSYKVKLSEDGKCWSPFSKEITIRTSKPNAFELYFGENKLCHKSSESIEHKREAAIRLAKRLMRYDVVSFDIFDTMILRPFSVPSDLFMLVGQELGIMDFSEIRINAEEQARKEKKVKYNNNEVTIHDIYQIIEKETGVKCEIGIKTEFSVEMELCFANPYIKRVYKLLKGQGKKIVALSDMYYSSEELADILHKEGYDLDEIIVSCEHNTSKRKGELYTVLKTVCHNRFGTNNIIHIGDNTISDIEMAKKYKIDTCYYKNSNDFGKPYRATRMSYLVGSAYSGIVNSYLHNGNNIYSPYHEVGFVYAGIYVMGFCNWLHTQVKEKGISKILFLAREGDIYQKAFLKMFDDVETEYVLWSRIPATLYAVESNRHPFLLQLVHHKANALYKTKIGVLLKKTGLESMTGLLRKYKLDEEDYIGDYNEKIVEEFLIDNWETVCDLYKNQRSQIQEYIKSIVKNHNNVAVVDVGWSGNNVLRVKEVISDIFENKCKVTCFLAAAREVNKTYMASMVQNAEVFTYMFSNCSDKFLHDFHQETNNKLNSFFFELLTQSDTPTFIGFSENGDIIYDIPEIENYEYIREIHDGILSFIEEYTNRFKNFKYMINISGFDAYMPFRMFVSDLSWIRNYFGDYVFGRDLFSTGEKNRMETVKEVLAKANL